MIDREEISARIQQYIIKESYSEKEDVRNDTLIFENSLLDSMGFLFLIEFLKDEFEIDVEDQELIDDNFKSINRITEFVVNKLGLNIKEKEAFVDLDLETTRTDN